MINDPRLRAGRPVQHDGVVLHVGIVPAVSDLHVQRTLARLKPGLNRRSAVDVTYEVNRVCGLL
jgi:hypothetical protein